MHRTPTKQLPLDQFPSGVQRYDFRDELSRLERASRFPELGRNLFDEGPHLIATDETPWGDEVRHEAVDAYMRFVHGETWISGAGAREMEQDIVAWMGGILGADAPAGIITGGGSESNMCAILAAKERAGRGGSVVFPATAHYSLHKLCRMFGLEAIPVPTVDGSLCEVDPDAIEAAIRPDTIAVVATAGTWSYGTVEPIEAIGEIAARRGIYLHVDAAFGGYILPFLERGGYDPDLPLWDFRVEGVCSITADVHKNGMAPPPVSTLFFRDASVLAHAKAICPPNGTMSGTRGTGPIAGAWTMVKLLGEAGYIAISQKSMALRDRFVEGATAIGGLQVYPGSRINMSLVYSDEIDLRPVVDALRERGWMFSARPVPAPVSLVVVPMPQSDGQIGLLLDDLRDRVALAPLLADRPAGVAGEPLSVYGF